ncbi:hypothetical protein [Achromobacter sp. DH1f]|uniref:hypothetical protein n=1 Tax=Achromobacter sp. DH1f TaxID=1397275 RepID=UPI000468CFFE|nr:hypothetical protein [Achromobacter sp. DH1f]
MSLRLFKSPAERLRSRRLDSAICRLCIAAIGTPKLTLLLTALSVCGVVVGCLSMYGLKVAALALTQGGLIALGHGETAQVVPPGSIYTLDMILPGIIFAIWACHMLLAALAGRHVLRPLFKSGAALPIDTWPGSYRPKGQSTSVWQGTATISPLAPALRVTVDDDLAQLLSLEDVIEAGLRLKLIGLSPAAQDAVVAGCLADTLRQLQHLHYRTSADPQDA